MKIVKYRGMYVRHGTSDLNIVDEVLINSSYQRPTMDFDVRKGDYWLDLGGNVGAFARYCAKKRASCCVSFEPDPDTFKILWTNNQENPQRFKVYESAVTASEDTTVDFFTYDELSANFSRSSALPIPGWQQKLTVQNTPISLLNPNYRKVIYQPGYLEGRPYVDDTGVPSKEPRHPVIPFCPTGRPWHGIKMDIEGGEFEILDKKLLPPCKRLVLEYHTSRDPSVDNLKSRLQYLQETFSQVDYPPEFDRVFESGEPVFKAFFDRLIFCTM